eukprot:536287-Pleurochrysis_carterae.AAC.1
MCAEQQSTAEATSTESKPSSEFVGTVTPTQRKPPAPKPKTSSKGIFAPAVLQVAKMNVAHSSILSAFHTCRLCVHTLGDGTHLVIVCREPSTNARLVHAACSKQ